MKIYPCKLNGQPVDILVEPVGPSPVRRLKSCVRGNKHRLSLSLVEEPILHNHCAQEIQAEEAVAQLAGSAGAAIECVRIKLRLKDGIAILT